ncbi:MAG: hypothetical protein AAFR87_29850 [Bacteroidota bacterium]
MGIRGSPEERRYLNARIYQVGDIVKVEDFDLQISLEDLFNKENSMLIPLVYP